MADSMHLSLDAAMERQADAEQVVTLANRCICAHAFGWHHDQRGCQYHGNGKGRCRCLRDVPTAVEDSPWLADLIARERADAAQGALREAADDMRAVLLSGHTLGMPSDDWLRARADRIARQEGEPDGCCLSQVKGFSCTCPDREQNVGW